jgi:hypothetical protein
MPQVHISKESQDHTELIQKIKKKLLNYFYFLAHLIKVLFTLINMSMEIYHLRFV